MPPEKLLNLKSFHLGNGVYGIYNMHRPYGNNHKLEDKEFTEFLSSLKFKYIFAITANYFQKPSVEILKEQGFRNVISFYSKHNCSHETLTLWTKIQSDMSDLSKEPVNEGPWNCSICFNRQEDDRILFLTTKFKNESKENLKSQGYLKIKKMPLWFKVENEHIVK